MQTLTCNNGVEIPQLGFGVFLVPAEEVVQPVLDALTAGYRLIDTATLYGNEEGVGRAVRDSGISRSSWSTTSAGRETWTGTALSAVMAPIVSHVATRRAQVVGRSASADLSREPAQ